MTDEAAAPQDDTPLRVLFVCTANICRSPYMELTARRLAAGDPTLEFASAGTHGFTDAPMDPPMIEVLPADTDGSDAFRSRRLTPEHLAWADVVLTAEASHRQFVLDDDPSLFRKVFSLGQFVESMNHLDGDLHGRELITALQQRRGPASEALDVADPYRRGEKAARAAADHLDQLLRAAVSALSAAGRAV